ncbi:MAG: hypothetical protein WC135_03180 [Bacteroidales bacterium]
MKRKAIKYILFYLLVALALLPLIQQVYPFVKVDKLNGEFEKVAKPKLLLNDWLSGDFQTQFDNFTNDTIGFKPFFVRTYGQVNYSVFSTSGNKGLVVGKEGYVYELNYINAYNGINYVGQEKIDSLIFKLEKIQDTLKKLNKEIIVILAPTKADFYSEYIPDRYSVMKKSKTNYKDIKNKLSKTQINTIDFNHWFKQMKDTSTYTLINRNGIHWTRYGELLAMDSIIKYVSKIRNCDLPNIVFDSLNYGKAQFTDNDIGKALNLFWIKDDLKLVYPVFRYDNSNVKTEKPKSLVIGDSFYWGMFSIGFSDKVFREGDFWYYFHNIYPENYGEGGVIPKFVALIDLKEEIKKFDLIIIMQTEPSLDKFSFGFIDRAYDMFFVTGNGMSKTSDRIKYYIEIMKADKKWFALIKDKAKKQKLTVDEVLYNDAKYVIEQEDK